MQVFTTEQVFEDSGLFLFGRGLAPDDGLPFVQADISAIVLKVYDADDTSTAIYDSTLTPLTVSSYVFNSLQTSDARWTKDSTGYNFRFPVTAAMLPAGGKTYRFEFKFTPAAGEVFFAVFEVPTLGLYGS